MNAWDWLVPAAPLVPLALAGLAAFRAVRCRLPALSVAASLPALLAALTASETVFHVPWLLLGTAIGLDAMGRTFLTLFALLYAVAAWHSVFYLRDDARRGIFAMHLLLAMAGSFGVALARDVVSFYAAFAIMSFAAYGLVAHDRAPASLRAARIYIGLVVFGELALFAGSVLAAARSGTAFGPGFEAPGLAVALVGLGFAIKAGLVPVHFWLPLAHPAAPAPASAVLSGAMIKVGLLGALRYMPVDGFGPAAPAIVLVGCATAVFGVVIGVLQTDPKAVLGYSSISQMGLIAMGLGLAAGSSVGDAAVAATLLFALHHGLAKAALFMGSASRLRGCPVRARRLRLAGLVLPAIALAGAPLTSGAIVKGAMKAVEHGPQWLDLFLSLSSLGTALLMVRFISLMLQVEGKEKPHTQLPWAVAVATSTGFMWLWPPAAVWLGHTVSLDSIQTSAWPVVAGGALGLALGRMLHPERAPIVPPGDLWSGVERAAGFFGPWRPWRRPGVGAAHVAAVPVQARLVALERRGQTWSAAAFLLCVVAAVFLAAAMIGPR